MIKAIFQVKLIALTAGICLSQSAIAQPVEQLLFVSDFDVEGAGNWRLNSTPTTTNTGVNRWIINDSFDGIGLYPNTPSQKITAAGLGQISTPDGIYMHISDSNSNAQNANFDPAMNSEYWAELNMRFCTYGYTKIKLAFWWQCVGGPNAYGELYYSKDNGATWINADGMKYNNQQEWAYREYSNPDWIDVLSLRFAFRWYNDGAAASDIHPLAIDDFMVVSESEQTGTVQINSIYHINQGPPPGNQSNAFDTICYELDLMTFVFQTTDTICPDKTFVIEITDDTVSGAVQVLGLQPNLQASAFTFPAELPPGFYSLGGVNFGPAHTSDFETGKCYRWRMRMISPPYSKSPWSENNIGCIYFKGGCADSITLKEPAKTMQEPLMGFDNICINSLISQTFYSEGAYFFPNEYVLELSDINGDFSNPSIINSAVDDFTYDPALGYPEPPVLPGSLGGLIPDVDTGCGYMLRITSTNPVVVSDTFGPYCIFDCGVEPNNNQSISIASCDEEVVVCYPVDFLSPVQDVLPPLTNFVNDFHIQIIDAMTMAVVAQGPPLQINKLDTNGFEVCLKVPKLSQLGALGLAPGTPYFYRIVSADNVILGSIQGFSINAIGGAPLTITTNPSLDSIICGAQQPISFFVNPAVQTSNYVWTLGGMINQQFQPIPPPGISLNFGGAPSGKYTMTVQEVNGPCAGPPTTIEFEIQGPPNVNFDGDRRVCVGDTVTYSVTFISGTYYDWIIDGGIILDSANQQVTIFWNQVGQGNITLSALNRCGGNQLSENITILPRTDLKLRPHPDTTVCAGDQYVAWAQNLNPFTGAFGNEFYWTFEDEPVIIDSVLIGDSISSLTFTADSSGWMVVAANYQGCSDIDSFYLTVLGLGPDQEHTICRDDSVRLLPFANAVSDLKWTPTATLNQPTDTTPWASPKVTTVYTLTANTQVCGVQQHLATVNVIQHNIVVDTSKHEVLRGESIQLDASGGITYNWQPANSLDDPTAPNPWATPDSTTVYTVTVTDALGCSLQYEVLVEVFDVAIAVPNAFSPNGDGKNDRLFVINFGLDELISFRIYNRYGEIVFETADETIGWDGTYKDEPQELGTYVYVVQARLKGGELRELEGDVILLR